MCRLLLLLRLRAMQAPQPLILHNDNYKIPASVIQHFNLAAKFHVYLRCGGAPKSNPPGKILYLWNYSNFFRQIYDVYIGGFKPQILQISLQYLVAFKNYNLLNLNVHFSK